MEQVAISPTRKLNIKKRYLSKNDDHISIIYTVFLRGERGIHVSISQDALRDGNKWHVKTMMGVHVSSTCSFVELAKNMAQQVQFMAKMAQEMNDDVEEYVELGGIRKIVV
jgi:hypothetical protein